MINPKGIKDTSERRATAEKCIEPNLVVPCWLSLNGAGRAPDKTAPRSPTLFGASQCVTERIRSSSAICLKTTLNKIYETLLLHRRRTLAKKFRKRVPSLYSKLSRLTCRSEWDCCTGRMAYTLQIPSASVVKRIETA